MNLTSAARGFLVFLLALPGWYICIGNDDWTVTYTSSNVCALRGSTVDITCTYKYPYKMSSSTLVETLWFTKGDHKQPVDLLSDTDYAGRVEYRCGENSCSWFICKGKCNLRIRDLRQTDSAEYKFRFTTNRPGGKYTGDPGVTLSVTGLSVEVTPVATVTEGQRVTLTCITSCPLTDKPSYMWYQNNGPVTGPESPENQLVLDPVSPQHAGNYACSVRNYPHLRSPEETLTVQYAPKTSSVTVSPSGEVVEGSSVTLSCSSDANPAANYTWFKVNTDNSSRDLNQGQQLVFGPIMSSDSGQYLCEAKNELGTISLSIYINVKCK
ncbi:unnamed protein product [Merluccius merluccius]